jgi:hypothetical protein
MSKLRGALALFAVLLSNPTPALADAYEAALMRAATAKESAMEDPAPTRWQLAFEYFLEADGMAPSAETKYELGLLAAQLRQDDLAVEYYEASLALNLTEPARSKALGFVDKNGLRMARLLVRGSRGNRVRVRGIARGTLPLDRPLVVLAGDAVVEVVEPTRSVADSRTVTLSAGATTEVDWNSQGARRAATEPVEPQTRLESSTRPLRPMRTMTAPLTTPSGGSPQMALDQGSPGRAAGRWVLGAGVGLLLSSGAMVAVSAIKLSEQRRQLREACDEPLPGATDGCAHARPGKYEDALGIADGIARWQFVQGAAWVGVGVGALGSALGWALLTRHSPSRKTAVRWVPATVIGPQTTCFIWQEAF